ncbi:MAG: hypothetical protein QS721_01745 [Candidatus Endonucleobacter sp. (ex Gigantidas childressi)]|nr:hypothetical protein [Candidatus Endonucleobacter sp. (ex Gigantidas childressi)]
MRSYYLQSTPLTPVAPAILCCLALLLGTWYRLSDVQLAQCLYMPVAFQVATLLAAFAHSNHLLLLGSCTLLAYRLLTP